jgi:ethanolamine utilization microcompartment shell protein EutS
VGKVDLRTLVFIDSLQPQLTGYISTIARGYLPVTRDASMVIEVAPGIAINRITDVAVKKTSVIPAIQFVERAYGTLEFHHHDQAEVREAGRQVLEHLELTEKDRLKPVVMTSEIITHLHDYQAMLINRVRYGSMFIAGKTLYILEVHPAGYAAFAANEAEKASPITLVDAQFSGAFGRLYLAGSEAEIEEAAKAVHKALAGVDGRENKAGGGPT